MNCVWGGLHSVWRKVDICHGGTCHQNMNSDPFGYTLDMHSTLSTVNGHRCHRVESENLHPVWRKVDKHHREPCHQTHRVRLMTRKCRVNHKKQILDFRALELLCPKDFLNQWFDSCSKISIRAKGNRGIWQQKWRKSVAYHLRRHNKHIMLDFVPHLCERRP